MSKISIEELSQAARTNDARADAGETLPQWAARNNVNVADLVNVAKQRALRAAAMFIDGADPAIFRGAKDFVVPLSPRATAMLRALTACVIDGFAIGRAVQPKED